MAATAPKATESRMEQATVQKCQELIGYRFADPSLLALALTHASVAPKRLESNERLEFLGDAVLALVVCHELYGEHEELLEGKMTKIKSAVVSREICAAIAEEIGICELLFLGKGMASPDSLPQSVAAAVFESLIAAVYLDGGLAPARRFVLKHLRPHIAEAMENQHQRNYKSLLQQYAQREYGQMPEYLVLDEKGPDHDKCFEVAVVLQGRHYPSSWGRTKKEAEQQAALKALAQIGVVDKD
ncbi:MAG: ribonuclease III [Planctomycetota bacterium]|nr:ribonuclease III [Planctomycetota bacterium]